MLDFLACATIVKTLNKEDKALKHISNTFSQLSKLKAKSGIFTRLDVRKILQSKDQEGRCVWGGGGGGGDSKGTKRLQIIYRSGRIFLGITKVGKGGNSWKKQKQTNKKYNDSPQKKQPTTQKKPQPQNNAHNLFE